MNCQQRYFTDLVPIWKTNPDLILIIIMAMSLRHKGRSEDALPANQF